MNNRNKDKEMIILAMYHLTQEKWKEHLNFQNSLIKYLEENCELIGDYKNNWDWESVVSDNIIVSELTPKEFIKLIGEDIKIK